MRISKPDNVGAAASSLNPSAGPLVKRTEPTTSKVYDAYWRFAAERQEIYFRRLAGQPGPWTQDPVLSTFKFTNAYRAADRVSQYLIGHVIYGESTDERDTVFRTLLFKLFNKIETWELVQQHLGKVSLANFDVDQVDSLLSQALTQGSRIYSAAYIMPNAPRHREGSYKHRTHLDLIKSIVRDGSLERIIGSVSMKDLYENLLALPSIGPFLAYQFAIDLNYSSHFNFSENDFVQPGPGALNGLRKCFSSLGDYSPADAIRWVTERQELEFKQRDIAFASLWGRPLQLIDCQNLFCEVDKYARVTFPEFSALTGRARIKQKFAPLATVPRPSFPPKWQLKTDEPVSTLHQPKPIWTVRRVKSTAAV